MLNVIVLALALQAATTEPSVTIPSPPAQGPATASDVPDPDQIAHPHWLRLPSGGAFASTYPERAQRFRVSGGAVIKCEVLGNGRLGGCVVLAERPAGWGFGAAALRLSSTFAMPPPSPTTDGRPWTVTFPVRYIMH